MKRKILPILAMLALAPLVFAFDTKTFLWTNPTERVNGAPLPAEEIAATEFACDNGWEGSIEHTAGSTPTEYRPPDGTFPAGTYSCNARTVDTMGLRSDWSNPVNFTVDPAQPLPPVLSVQ